jgi:hypothetical protein
MATASTPQPQAKALVADTISITCPPLPGGGLLLQPNFKACGDWDSSAANPVLSCVFTTDGGVKINGTVNANQPPPNTWSATFNIAAGTKGQLQATIKVNNVVTAQSGAVTNLQVVANGGGTCTC